MTAKAGWGFVLLVTRGTSSDAMAARFVMPVGIYACADARDEKMAAALGMALSRRDADKVRSLRRGSEPDETAWLKGDGWWLSTAAPT
jgi:protein-L-isoaspartate(D-aspartate) O-methyltransferase